MTMSCGDPEPHEPHRKLGDGRPCDGVDPTPPNLADRIRERLAVAFTTTPAAVAAAAAQEQREAQLLAEHGPGLRAAIGPALRNAETYGTGWIRIDARCAPGQPVAEVFDWTISSPSPTTIVVRDEPTQERDR
jgi:hypothetical protein